MVNVLVFVGHMAPVITPHICLNGGKTVNSDMQVGVAAFPIKLYLQKQNKTKQNRHQTMGGL